MCRYALKRFVYIFVPSDLDILPLYFKFATLYLISFSAMFPLNLKFLRLSYVEKVGGTGRIDGQTGATVNAVP